MVVQVLGSMEAALPVVLEKDIRGMPSVIVGYKRVIGWWYWTEKGVDQSELWATLKRVLGNPADG